jgi:uncharacterized coiled-coil protein SlyX
MIEKFLRLFPLFRKQEAALDEMAKALAVATKHMASDGAFAESLNRHIEALEGRDQERLNRIAELEAKLAEQQKLVRELRKHLSGLLPGE